MTPKQQERIINKIKKIKAALAADKRQWGGYYHDGGGLRYAPPKLYVELEDYKGGMRYFNWFDKNFPDDIGYPSFLFEWIIVLFKTGKLKEAEKKAFQVYCDDVRTFNKYFGRQITRIPSKEDFEWQYLPIDSGTFYYNPEMEKLEDFTEWLEKFLTSEKFILLSNKFLDIQKRLTIEKNPEKRDWLLNQARELSTEM